MNPVEHPRIGATETINRLLHIADREQRRPVQLLRIAAGQQINDAALSFVDILTFVHQQEPDTALVTPANLRMRQQQFFRFHFQIVIGQHPAGPLLTRPLLAGLLKPLAQVGKQLQHRLIEHRSPQGFRRPFSFLQGIAQFRAAAHIAEILFQFLQAGRIFAGFLEFPLDVFPPVLQDQQTFLRHGFLFCF